MRTARLTSSVCIAALVLSACGSSYKGLSKPEFVKQASAICTKGAAKANTIGNSVGNNPTIQQVKDAYSGKLIPAFQDEVTQLRALKPPKADRAAISKMLDDLSTGFDQAATSIKGLKSLQDLSSLPEPAGLKAANKEAKAYGLGKCSGS